MNRLKELRKAKKLTQQELAEKQIYLIELYNAGKMEKVR